MTGGAAITSKVALDDNTHLEPVRYASGQDAMASLYLAYRWRRWGAAQCADGHLCDSPYRFPSFIVAIWVGQTFAHPAVMQPSGHMRIRMRRRWWPFPARSHRMRKAKSATIHSGCESGSAWNSGGP